MSALLSAPVLIGLALALAVLGFFCLGYAAGYVSGRADGKGRPSP